MTSASRSGAKRKSRASKIGRRQPSLCDTGEHSAGRNAPKTPDHDKIQLFYESMHQTAHQKVKNPLHTRPRRPLPNVGVTGLPRLSLGRVGSLAGGMLCGALTFEGKSISKFRSTRL